MPQLQQKPALRSLSSGQVIGALGMQNFCSMWHLLRLWERFVGHVRRYVMTMF